MQKVCVAVRAVARLLMGGGGGGHIILRVLVGGFLLKAIVVTICEHEYMNIHPPPPANYRV